MSITNLNARVLSEDHQRRSEADKWPKVHHNVSCFAAVDVVVGGVASLVFANIACSDDVSYVIVVIFSLDF